MNHGHFHAEKKLRFAIILVSTTRTLKEDVSGEKLSALIGSYAESIVRDSSHDDSDEILGALKRALPISDVVVFIGGTGLSKYDLTTTTLRKISEREVSGFGELFRSSSGNQYAYLSDATMFLYSGRIICCLPGSPDAMEVGAEVIKKLVSHAFHELHKE